MKQLSPKSFQDPLLLALGEFADYQAGRVIGCKEVYPIIFKRLQINPENYGNTNLGIPWVERWVQFAFNALCHKGYATRLGRGKWALTPKGVQAAFALTPFKPSMESDKGGKDCSSDIHLQKIILVNQPCAGYYTKTSSICNKCYLAQLCRESVGLLLARLATRLIEEDTAKGDHSPTEQASVFSLSQSQKLVLRDDGRYIKAVRSAVCPVCHLEITVGEKVFWFPEVVREGLITQTEMALHWKCKEWLHLY